LIDLEASTCVIDESFAKLHKIQLVQKIKAIHVEVIDGRPLVSSSVIQETTSLQTNSTNHSSQIVHNIIHSPSNPIILGLSWLENIILKLIGQIIILPFFPRNLLY